MHYILLTLVLLFSAHTMTHAEESWQDQFQDPPMSARPHTWWHWMGGNVTREGITQDLEAMKEVGLGGFQAFHVSSSIPSGPVGYMSAEWRKLMTHTVREADRLGLKMCLHNCAGWSSSGGPWITPELSMLQVVWTESYVDGPAKNASIDRPQANLDYYEDICTLAFPTLKGETAKTPGFRLADASAKAGFKRLDDPQPDTRTPPPGGTVSQDVIVDLSDKLRSDSTLDWQVPAGKWTIIRFGYTTTMQKNRPAPPEGEGLECDKLSSEGALAHWNGIVQKVLNDIGPLAGKTLDTVLIDSYETGVSVLLNASSC